MFLPLHPNVSRYRRRLRQELEKEQVSREERRQMLREQIAARARCELEREQQETDAETSGNTTPEQYEQEERRDKESGKKRKHCEQETDRGQEKEQRSQRVEQDQQKRKRYEQEKEHYQKQMLAYAERLETFDEWPTDHEIKPEKLAGAGFIWSSEDNEVNCEICKLRVLAFKELEDPWLFHEINYDVCTFVREEMSAGYIGFNPDQTSGSRRRGHKIHSLRQYCYSAGLRFEYKNVCKDCITYKHRMNKLLGLLHDAGLEGIPTMKKCRALLTERKMKEGEQMVQEVQHERESDNRGQERGQRGAEGEQRGHEKQQQGAEGERCGQERQQHGAKGDQCVQESEQSGAEREQRGQEGEQRGVEGEKRGQGSQQRGAEGDKHEQERERRGTEKEQRGQEREQRGAEGEQRGKERGQRGVEGAERGQERQQHEGEGQQRGQEREQRGAEGGQRGQEREQRGAEGELRGQEKEQRGAQREQRGQNKEQRGRNNWANELNIIEVKKIYHKPRLRPQVPSRNITITLDNIITAVRACDTTYESLADLISNLPLCSNTRKTVQNKINSDMTEMCCNVCDKIYISKYHLEKHMLEHNQELNSAQPNCEECGKSFDTESRLEDHQRTCRKEPVTARGGVAKAPPPQRRRPEQGMVKDGTQDESPMEAQNQQTNSALSKGIGTANQIKDHCKLCFTEEPVDLEKHYVEEHNIWDPSSIVCSNQSFLVPSPNKRYDVKWFRDQYSATLSLYTRNDICRLCNKYQCDLDDHYEKYHKVRTSDFLFYTKRLMRERGVIVPGAESFKYTVN